MQSTWICVRRKWPLTGHVIPPPISKPPAGFPCSTAESPDRLFSLWTFPTNPIIEISLGYSLLHTRQLFVNASQTGITYHSVKVSEDFVHPMCEVNWHSYPSLDLNCLQDSTKRSSSLVASRLSSALLRRSSEPQVTLSSLWLTELRLALLPADTSPLVDLRYPISQPWKKQFFGCEPASRLWVWYVGALWWYGHQEYLENEKTRRVKRYDQLLLAVSAGKSFTEDWWSRSADLNRDCVGNLVLRFLLGSQLDPSSSNTTE